jgi:electron transport complex protein RnfG
MLDIIKLGVFLLVLAGVGSFGVSYVNSMAEPLIAEQALKAKIASFKEVYPQGEEVKDESAQFIKSNTNSLIKEINVAYISGAPSGVIYLVEPKGYGGPLKIMAGFDIAQKKLIAIKVLSQTETPGLGAKAKDSFFQDRYKDKSSTIALEVTKTPPVKDNQIQAITASTITSKAVTSGINAARENFMSNFVK